MASDHVKNWRNRKKLELVLYKGGKCEICQYDNIDCLRAFVFHHKNPKEKEFSISGKSWSFDSLKQEVDKCALLCCRCHAEVHDELDREAREARLKIYKKPTEERIKICLVCKKDYKACSEGRKYCSSECASLDRRKADRPPKDVLEQLLVSNSLCSIGRMYNVSDNAVRKWAKAYNLLGYKP